MKTSKEYMNARNTSFRKSEKFKQFQECLPNVFRIRDAVKIGQKLGINKYLIESFIPNNTTLYTRVIRGTYTKRTIPSPFEVRQFPPPVKVDNSIEKCIQILKDAGYKIQKPVVTYEEI